MEKRPRLEFDKGKMANNKVPDVLLDDVICPICLGILIEPVTMPCKHELCLVCFKQNVNEANLVCPVCRKRISSWARKACRENTLVNVARWDHIRKTFSDKVERKLRGTPNRSCTDDEVPIKVRRSLCEPGEIRKEFEEFLSKSMREVAEQHEIENKKSEEFIKTLQKIDQEEEVKRMMTLRKDHAIAKLLNERLSRVSSSSQERNVVDHTLNHNSESLRPESSRASFATSNSRRFDKTELEKRPHSANEVMCKRKFTWHAKKSACNKSVNVSEKDVSIRNGGSAIDESETSGVIATEEVSDDDTESLANSETSLEVGNDSEAGAGRSNSAVSEDSIAEELRHFRPIRSAPRTPPRCRPDGLLEDEPMLIRSTPRNIMTALNLSECSGVLEEKFNENSCLRKRLASVESDRQKKSTFTVVTNASRPNVAAVNKENPELPASQKLKSRRTCKQKSRVDHNDNIENAAIKTKSRKAKLSKSQSHASRCTNKLQRQEKERNGDVSFNRKVPKEKFVGTCATPVNEDIASIAKRKTEEDDYAFALQLQRRISDEIRNYQIDRRKGTPDAYNLRKRRVKTS